MNICRTLLVAMLAAGGLGTSPTVRGGTYIYNFGNVLRGDTPSAASTPWVTAEFTDVAPGQVRMTFTASNLSGRENVAGLLLNLNPALNPCLLVFNQIGSSGSFRRPRISAGDNAFRGRTAGSFDLRFQFGGHRGGRRQFGAGDQVTYLITGIPELTATSFDFTSFNPRGPDPVFALAQVNDVGPCDGSGFLFPGAGFTPVPEPGTPALLVSALALFSAGQRRWGSRNRSQRSA